MWGAPPPHYPSFQCISFFGERVLSWIECLSFTGEEASSSQTLLSLKGSLQQVKHSLNQACNHVNQAENLLNSVASGGKRTYAGREAGGTTKKLKTTSAAGYDEPSKFFH